MSVDPSNRKISLFSVPQLSAPGEVAKNKVLPSFLYLPGEYDVTPESIVHPWQHHKEHFAGVFAREQGSRVPARLVSSAKSWLCHGKVDRMAPILPWGADASVPRLSPVAASAAYLKHLRDAWNHRAGADEDKFLENQAVIITVPASFDEVARDLTVEAAKLAGYGQVTLIEEPLAAFYSWLVYHEKDWDRHVKPGELICVVDVGGGTSDFSLITLRETEGSPRFERIAVGDHLILGGDNMDLALARHSETLMGKSGARISANRWQALCHQCRQAKEAILSGSMNERVVTLMGEGGKLIGGTLSARLKKDDVERIILEGFFPVVSSDERGAAPSAKGGITEFGLPYAQDPAITRHLCRFIERNAQEVKRLTGKDNPFPDLILFNGGALSPDLIKDRIREAVRSWFCAEIPSRVLENPDLDLAVSRGAAYYGMVKAGHGVRVGSGSPRGYYLGLAGVGGGAPEKALCLMERGVEEGSLMELSAHRFDVLANQPVSFSVYSSSFRSGDRTGDLIDVDDTLTLMPPIRTVIQYGKKAGEIKVPVKVSAHYTEMGTLELWCKSLVSDHRWRLLFQLRDSEESRAVPEDRVFEEELVQKSLECVSQVFGGDQGGLKPERLSNAVVEACSTPRERWPLSFLRRMADALISAAEGRGISAEHEARWLNLTGFCLRPGFGDALDEHRVRTLWALYKKGPLAAKSPQVRLEWWVLWRRVAGGLSAGQQRQVIQDLAPVLRPKKAGERAKLSAEEENELWMLAANLERLMVKDKVDFGRTLLSRLDPKKTNSKMLWALSRIGARDLLYGPLDRVIPPDEAGGWISELLSKSWSNPRPVGMALSQLARKTGDRKRDMDEALAEKVKAFLAPFDWGRPLVKVVSEVTEADEAEKASRFGESLPAGIILKTGE
ncbi:MAG: hsp70 family protein [Deltaproteobacteria bacterium]|nr:hsp70 family protein [Deltaproteobacteria bacterium]